MRTAAVVAPLPAARRRAGGGGGAFAPRAPRRPPASRGRRPVRAALDVASLGEGAGRGALAFAAVAMPFLIPFSLDDDTLPSPNPARGASETGDDDDDDGRAFTSVWAAATVVAYVPFLHPLAWFGLAVAAESAAPGASASSLAARRLRWAAVGLLSSLPLLSLVVSPPDELSLGPDLLPLQLGIVALAAERAVATGLAPRLFFGSSLSPPPPPPAAPPLPPARRSCDGFDSWGERPPAAPVLRASDLPLMRAEGGPPPPLPLARSVGRLVGELSAAPKDFARGAAEAAAAAEAACAEEAAAAEADADAAAAAAARAELEAWDERARARRLEDGRK